MIDKLINTIGGWMGGKNTAKGGEKSGSLRSILVAQGLKESVATILFPKNENQLMIPKQQSVYQSIDKSFILLQDKLNLLEAVQVSNVLQVKEIIFLGEIPEDHIKGYLVKKYPHKILKNASSIDENLPSVLWVTNQKPNSKLQTISTTEQSDFVFIAGAFRKKMTDFSDTFVKKLNEVFDSGKQLIGFAVTNSLTDGRSSLSYRKSKTSKVPADSNLEVRLKEGKIEFGDLLTFFGMFEQLKTNPLLKRLPINITKQMEDGIKKQAKIINSMNKKERGNYRLFEQTGRIERVAKGSGVSVNEVKNLISVLQQLREKGKDIEKMAADPSALMNLFKDQK